MPVLEIPGKVGEFVEDWRVATLCVHTMPTCTEFTVDHSDYNTAAT